MNKCLIIAEKPSLAMKIVNAIGDFKKSDGYFENDKYIATFAYGHLLTLFDVDDYFNRGKTGWSIDELPYIPDEFRFKLKEDSGVLKQYNIIKTLISRSDIDSIVNCGDADREGEVIINNIIYNIFNEVGIQKTIKRLWLPEQTEETMRMALSELKDISIYKNLYSEGLARTYVDWILGINLTRYISIKSNTYLPVGRVLVPVVRYIYDREVEIENFKAETFYEIGCIIKKDELEIKTKLKDLRFTKNEKVMADKLLHLLQHEKVMVKNIEKKDIIKHPRKLFSLDTLQNKLFDENKIGLNDTLAILQNLYENGYVTYPRTNTEYLSNNEKDKVMKLINLFNEKYNINLVFKDSKSIFDDKKIESHSAVIPTLKTPGELNDNENLVYNTIRNRFISNFLNEDTIIEETIVTIEIADRYIELKGNVVKNEGFFKYEKSVIDSQLPSFYVGEELNTSLFVDSKETQKPKKINESQLNKFLKNPFRSEKADINEDQLYKELLQGIEIGTVATRASIIENAKKYGYIVVNKNSIDCTKKGKYLIDTLDKLNVDMSKEKTVDISKSLKGIYKQELLINTLINDIRQDLVKTFNIGRTIQIEKLDTRNILGKCPVCGQGNIIEGKKAYGCTRWKEGCKFTVWKEICGKKLTQKQIEDLINKGVTSKVKGFKGKKNTFDAKLKLNDGKVQFL